jgi:hypothetical protein
MSDTPATALTEVERRHEFRDAYEKVTALQLIPWNQRSRDQWLQLYNHYSRLAAVAEAQYISPPEREEFE